MSPPGAKLLEQAHSGGRIQDRTNRNVELFSRLARASPFWQGVTLASVALNTGTTDVNHTLARPFLGWLVVRLQAASAVTVWEVAGASTQASSSTSIPLTASGSCTVTLWVF